MKFLLSLIFTSLIALNSLIQPLSIHAQEPATNSAEEQPTKVVINFFYSKTCPHCQVAAPFLQQLSEKYTSVELHAFEITQNPANAQLMQAAAEKVGIEAGGVPLIIVGDQPMIGYGDDQTHGAYVESLVKTCIESNDCTDILSSEIDQAITSDQVIHEQDTNSESSSEQIYQAQDTMEKSESTAPIQDISVPFIGSISPELISLPLLTIIIGLLDGFNPCAMWALIFLISLLLSMKNKSRRWILGTAFIFTSGFVYFLFMTAWLNFFLFVGMIYWIRLAIGILAVGAGIYNLKDYLTNKDGACSTEGSQKKKEVLGKLSKATHHANLLIAIVSISVLAAGVNLIELFCSAGFPAIYTQVLSMSDLNFWQYYGYLALYILMFMLDDLVIFIISMITLEMTGLDTKYARYSRLIGGTLILLIGIALIFKPELLMFG